MSVFTIIWICYDMEVLSICWDLEILYVDVWWSYDMYTLVMYDLYPLRLLRIFIKACCLIFVKDIASISWIYTLFACFIALIEIWRYTGGLPPKQAKLETPRPPTRTTTTATILTTGNDSGVRWRKIKNEVSPHLQPLETDHTYWHHTLPPPSQRNNLK